METRLETDTAASAAPRPSKLARFFGAVPKAFWYLFAGYIALSILLDVVAAPFVSYRLRWSLSYWGILFLPAGIALGALCCWGVRRIRHATRVRDALRGKGFTLLVIGGCLLLFAIQIWLELTAGFKGYDIDWEIMTDFDDPMVLTGYYSANPNNHFLGSVFAMLYSLSYSVGVEDPYHVIVIVGCACMTLSIGLLSFVARKIGGTVCGVCAFLLMFVFVGLSPNLFIPYSDSYGMIFTSAVIFLYICWKNPVKWPIMAYITCLGYYVKPTACAAFAAAILVSACLWLKHFFAERAATTSATDEATASPSPSSPSSPGARRKPLFIFCACLLGCLLALPLGMATVQGAKDQLNIRVFPQERVVPAHYLMLGFNTKWDGMFNNEDRDFSYQYHTPETMTEANLAEWTNRVRTLGPGGILHLLVKKNLILYNNGDSLVQRKFLPQMGASFIENEAIDVFYGRGPEMTDYEDTTDVGPHPWDCIAQALWFMILVGIALGFFRRNPSTAELALAISLLFLSGFLLIFECNPRYLFLFMPFYVVLAVRGWQAFGQWFCAWRANRARLTSSATPKEAA